MGSEFLVTNTPSNTHQNTNSGFLWVVGLYVMFYFILCLLKRERSVKYFTMDTYVSYQGKIQSEIFSGTYKHEWSFKIHPSDNPFPSKAYIQELYIITQLCMTSTVTAT